MDNHHSEKIYEEPQTPRWKLQLIRALPIIVALFSVIAVLNSFFMRRTVSFNYASVAVSALGIVAAAVYFSKKRNGYSIEAALTMISVWAILQALVITTVFPVADSSNLENPVWNVTQFLRLLFGFTFSREEGGFHYVQFNFMTPIYLAWVRRLRIVENYNE